MLSELTSVSKAERLFRSLEIEVLDASENLIAKARMEGHLVPQIEYLSNKFMRSCTRGQTVMMCSITPPIDEETFQELLKNPVHYQAEGRNGHSINYFEYAEDPLSLLTLVLTGSACHRYPSELVVSAEGGICKTALSSTPDERIVAL